jgi:hypothetical protein
MWIALANYFSFEDGPRYTTYLAHDDFKVSANKSQVREKESTTAS